MFPHIEGEEWRVAPLQWITCVRLLRYLKRAIGIERQPCPSRAEECDGFLLKLFFERVY